MLYNCSLTIGEIKMRHLIEELMQGKILQDGIKQVEPLKVKAAKVIHELATRLDHETKERVKAQEMVILEQADATYKEIMNEDYKRNFT